MAKKIYKQDVYTDYEQIKYTKKIGRVERLYGLFHELSKVEKDNFINLLHKS